jgi:hypothetical protein
VGIVIAVVAALGAACCFALAAVVQHGAARGTSENMLSLRLLLALVRNPRWAAGVPLPGRVNTCMLRPRSWLRHLQPKRR